MALRADGFCSLCFVLLARSIAKQTGLVSDQPFSDSLTADIASGLAIAVRRQRSRVDAALGLIHPG